MVFVSNPPINSFRTKRYAPIAPGPHTSHRTSGGVLTGLFGKKKIQKGCWCSRAHRRRRPPHENIFLWTQTPPRSVIQKVTSAKLMRGRMSKPPATNSLDEISFPRLRVMRCSHCALFQKNISAATWLILPVVICLSQRLSHACLSINDFIL